MSISLKIRFLWVNGSFGLWCGVFFDCILYPRAQNQQVITGRTNVSISKVLPFGTVSNMPWRKAGCKYSQDGIYFNMLEGIDALINVLGCVIPSGASGSIQAHLSGVIYYCSFHPCVQYDKFELDNVVSFVPPDGVLTLMTYRLKVGQSRSISSPLNCLP